MLGLPWGRSRPEPETRSYTTLLLSGQEASADGVSSGLTTAALEVAAGIWGRVLAGARIEGTDALTPQVRHRIGRDIIRCGESLHVVRVRGGLRLDPVHDWDVCDGWRYRLQVNEPPGKVVTLNRPAAGVMFVAWAVDEHERWRGVGPLDSARTLGKLAAASETKLLEELATPVAHILPIPGDGGSTTLDGLRSDVAAAKGKAVLLEGTAKGWQEGERASGTRHDWRAERLGPKPPEELCTLAGDVFDRVLMACGIPVSLAGSGEAVGTAAREDWRRFVLGTVRPVGAMIANAASVALDTEVRFDFAPLHAHDITARSTAVDKLVTAGMTLADARALVGL